MRMSTGCGSLGVCVVLADVVMTAGVAMSQETPDLTVTTAPANAVWLDSLELRHVIQDTGVPQGGRSTAGNPLKIKGVVYPHGFGTHAPSEARIVLDGCATRFLSIVGVDDETKDRGSVTFEVWVDGKKVVETPVIRGGEDPGLISVDLIGAREMELVVGDGGDNTDHDHADWAGALFLLAEGATTRPRILEEPPMPIAHGTDPRPRINNPRIVGTTPGRPFLFLIPASGEGPLEFSAKKLPAGLVLDRKTGIIRGSLKKAGRYDVTLHVKGPKGSDKRTLRIVGGEHKLALTPPMGWNSWNVWAKAVDDGKIRAAADAMIASGLAAHGFQYINIDDCWEGGRNEAGEIRANEKFPDMKALGDYIHAKGLRFGIYSSPGPRTCAGFAGSYQHEEQDARTWASWGVDYLKYDWCSYGDLVKDVEKTVPVLQKPYRVMREALDRCDRDIVYSLCQYGMGEVWKWGREVGGNLWRTTGDINDSWSSMSEIGFAHSDRSPFAGPGGWNDPDMLVVGRVGWGPTLHETNLSRNEQITHITLWSLLAAPLLIGCDMSNMDEFTIDLLSNDEVLDVDQDPLGKAAVRITERAAQASAPTERAAQASTPTERAAQASAPTERAAQASAPTDRAAQASATPRQPQEARTEVWARPLSDRTWAVGLFNRGRRTASVTVKWSDLGLKPKDNLPVRDLWQRKDLGKFRGSYTQEVRAHGAALIKVGKPHRAD